MCAHTRNVSHILYVHCHTIYAVGIYAHVPQTLIHTKITHTHAHTHTQSVKQTDMLCTLGTHHTTTTPASSQECTTHLCSTAACWLACSSAHTRTQPILHWARTGRAQLLFLCLLQPGYTHSIATGVIQQNGWHTTHAPKTPRLHCIAGKSARVTWRLPQTTNHTWMVMLHTIVLEEHSLKTPPASVALLVCLSAQSGSLQGRGEQRWRQLQTQLLTNTYTHSYWSSLHCTFLLCRCSEEWIR